MTKNYIYKKTFVKKEKIYNNFLKIKDKNLFLDKLKAIPKNMRFYI